MTGKVQECCGAPLPGPHPIAGSMSYLLTPYGDIHGGVVEGSVGLLANSPIPRDFS